MQLKRKHLRLVIWTMVVLTLITIYLLSNQTASQSNQLSSKLSSATQGLYEYISNTELTERQWNSKVRKLAHAIVFAILAFFLMLLCYMYRLKLVKAIAITLSCSVIFATADELHQLFVQGRGASASDVLIDSIGSSIAIALASVFFLRRNWDEQKKRTKNKK